MAAGFTRIPPTSMPWPRRESASIATIARLRTGKIFHGGTDDPKAWTEGGGAAEGNGGAGGQTMVIRPQEVPPKPPDVLPPLAQDVARVRAELSPLARKYAANPGKTQV
jgi:hypothetical protein